MATRTLPGAKVLLDGALHAHSGLGSVRPTRRAPGLPSVRRTGRTERTGRVGLVVLALLALPVAAHPAAPTPWQQPAAPEAAAPASDPSACFVPGDHVPLSEFVAARRGEVVSLSVAASILVALLPPAMPLLHTVRVVEYDPLTGSMTRYTPQSVTLGDPTGPFPALGQVLHTVVGQQVHVVVVDDALRNRFSTAPGAPGDGIVTHWDRTRHDGRGGWRLGWTDGVVGYDLVGGQLVELPAPPGLGFHGEPGDTYFWNTTRLALFADRDDSQLEARVPAHERYIAEDWSTHSVTALAAIHFSDQARRQTGIPVAHRNVTSDSVPLATQVRTGLVEQHFPLFQLVHDHVVRLDRPESEGAENSLASFLLPPGWQRHPPGPGYPVLFNSGYDTNYAVLNPDGPGGLFVGILGQLLAGDPTRRVVGIFSNGGGARACVALQASAIHNLNALFAEAVPAFSLDTRRLVCTGASRGATAGLALWSNPLLDPGLSARFILAGSPNTFPVESLGLYGNSTYARLQWGLAEATGYSTAYLPGWTNPDDPRQDAGALAAEALLGPASTADFDATLAAGAAPCAQQLAARGSTVVFKTATHDHSKSFAHMLRYVDALHAAGVPYRFEISYRLGHASTSTLPGEVELLQHLFEGSALPPEELGLFLRHPDPGEEVGHALATHAFVPARAPVFVEAPLLMAEGATSTFTVVGPPGMVYAVLADRLQPPAWFQQVAVPLDDPDPPTTLFTGVLEPLAALPGMSFRTHSVEAGYGPANVGPWEYRLLYYIVGEQLVELTSETSVPPEPGLESFEFWPSLYLGEFPPTPFDIESRVGGLSDDLLLHPPGS